MITRRPAGESTELSNERRVVNWLGTIAVAALVGVVYLAATASKTGIGIDTAVIVALIGVIAQCASSIGTRRTRTNTPTSDTPAPRPSPWTAQPPTYDPASAAIAADLHEGA
jgi:hypothetical protein